MKKVNLLFLTAVFAVLVSAFFALTSSASGSKESESPACCNKKHQECQIENKKGGAGELIMDNMSRQFISIASF
jgi:hypothetical protein